MCTGGIRNGLYVNFVLNQNDTITFLIDTGASICTLKQSTLDTTHHIDNTEAISISGIAGNLTTLGICKATITHGALEIYQQFHVVNDEFSVDGILGSDFSTFHHATIDLEEFLLLIRVGREK